MPDLDSPQTYRRLDPTGMAGRLGDAPRQCLAGWRQAWSAPLAGLEGPFEHIVIAGMGGSAIAGDLAADLASLGESPPTTVVREFRIPFALGRKALMIVCSYSGNTEETLSMFRHGLDMGARMVAVTAGGALEAEATRRGVPTLAIDAPGEPRSAAVYNFTLLLGLLARLGLLDVGEAEVAAAREALACRVESLSPDVSAGDNPAKRLAAELLDRLPVVCAGGLFRGVARRWKSQFNENAKVWAVYEPLPELLHNSVEAFGSWPSAGYRPMALLLEPNGAGGHGAARLPALANLLQARAVAHRVIPGCDGGPPAQLLDMLALGDYVSYYLALLRGVDPSPTPTLEGLKRPPAGD